MTATATPPPAGETRAAGPGRPPAPVGRRRGPRGTAPLLSAPLARALALTALALFAALRWGTLVDPHGGGRMALLALLALAAGAAVAQLSRLPAASQAPAAVAVVVAWAGASLLAAGVPASLVLNPDHWDDLAVGLQQGIEQIPRVVVPYDELDAWPRVAILLGGALLLALGCVLGLAPSRRGAPFRGGEAFGGGLGLRLGAAAPLVAAAVVPAAIMEPDAPVLLGAALFVLLAALLWLERLPRAHAPAALGLVLLAGAGGALALPRLDRAEPVLDVQALVEELDTPAAAQFDWTQAYGPLDWPRDGREVLRVESPVATYWKATNLDGFDGVRWVRTAPSTQGAVEREVPPEALAREGWRADVRVTLRSFSTSEVLGAGTTLGFRSEPTTFVPGASPGTWTSDKPLEPGDGYVAETLVPRPSQVELRSAGTDYPAWIQQYLMVGFPRRNPAAVGGWESTGTGLPASPYAPQDDGGWASGGLPAGPYAEVAALAQSLKAGTSTPYEYVLRVLDHLRGDFAYDERPPRRGLPLAAFLLRDRRGYCQQFAGSAALLLRLGGVPTRVAAGFTRGSRDGARNEFVVRDYDAHAWIEAWFPRLGWVRFDPTPTTAPARSGRAPQAPDAPRRSEGEDAPRPAAPAPAIERREPQDAGGGAGVAGGGDGDGGGVLPVLAAGAAALALLAGGAALVARRRPPTGPEELLAELERALRRTGRPPEPGLTLARLERRFHDAPDAAAYVRAIRLARYGGNDAEAAGVRATPRQRRALRTELARDLGAMGRLRALLALPPRLGR